MTVQITVQTTFADMSALAEGYVERVDGTYLVLPAGIEVPDGEWVQFEVRLTDGSAVLAGVGKSAGQRDHGEEYGAERYDLWIAEIQLAEGVSDVVWERIALAREQREGRGDPPTGEVHLEDVDKVRSVPPEAMWDKDASTATQSPESSPPAELELGDEDAEPAIATEIAHVAPAARPAAPRTPIHAAPPPPATDGLSRPSAVASWSPVADPPRGTGHGAGVFEYGDQGLPVPPSPPRPEGDVARVAPAPRPAE